VNSSLTVAGVDAGGTRTRVMIADGGGNALAEGSGPAGLLDPRDPSGAGGAVEVAVRDAAHRAGIALPLDRLWAGVAGAGREEGRVALEGELGARGLARHVRVGTDVEVAFEDAFPGGEAGILLIVGTGSIAMARGPEGEVARCGGWGGILGDEGSGYRIALEGLRAVCRAADGRERPTVLTRLLVQAAAVADAQALIPLVARADKGEIAALTPVVIRCADAGDAVAGRILDDSVVELVRQAEVSAYRVGYRPPFQVALAGGLVSEDGPFRERMIQGLERHGFGVRTTSVNGARGAVALALSMEE
jgi:N-acetylglucosamine kinase-like BadF-type ATPase